MNSEDKEEYYNSIIKNMTRICHDKCVTDKIDKLCLSACYHKYINTIGRMRELAIDKGDKVDSEYIFAIFNPRYDKIIDLLWSQGGSQYMLGPWHSNINLRYEAHSKIYPVKGLNPYRHNYENQ
jgi:hypothetical protein